MSHHWPLMGALMLLWAQPAAAHRLLPLALELEQTQPQRVSATLTRPAGSPMAAQVRVIFPGCASIGDSRYSRPPTNNAAWVEHFDLRCEGGLTGLSVQTSGLVARRLNLLVHARLGDGAIVRGLVTAQSPSYRVPPAATTWDVAARYLTLGAEHLLTGFDHLLFVLGLMFLVRKLWPLLLALTAFTVGHSITLALAALGWVQVWPQAVEVLIAMTLLYLGARVVLDAPLDGQPTTPLGHPWRTTLVFGLVHGFGFAGALSQTGLPSDHLVLALASFNLGIELAQLAFVLLCLGLLRWLPLPSAITGPRLRVLAGYAVGSLAAMWWLERLPGLVDGL